MNELPCPREALVVRTEFAAGGAWDAVRETLLSPGPHGFFADVALVDDRQYEGMTADQVLGLLPAGYRHPLLVLADPVTAAFADRPLLVVDLGERDGAAPAEERERLAVDLPHGPARCRVRGTVGRGPEGRAGAGRAQRRSATVPVPVSRVSLVRPTRLAASPRRAARWSCRGPAAGPSGPPSKEPTVESRAVSRLDELTGFLTRLTRLLLDTSGEGAEGIEETVTGAARALGGDAELLLVPDGAALMVTGPGGDSRTVTVRAFPEVFRLDRVTALKPLLAEVRAGGVSVREADRRLALITGSSPPYPWWARLLGILLFSLGFAPLMQPTWYEVASTAVLATIAATLAVAADRAPRLAAVLPLVASTVVSVVTIEVFARTPDHGGPVLLMLPALFFFVPGDYLSAAAAELAAGRVTTGAIRLVYASFLLVQLYLGVLLGVFATGTSTRALFDVAAESDLPRWALFLAWIVFTAGTVLAFAIPYRLFWPLLALVYFTVAVQSLFTKLIGETGGTFVAAAALTATATVLARAPHRPPRLVLLLPGFFTLTVGSLGMRGLTTLAGGYVVEGFQDLLKLVTIVTAIAVGMLFGAVLAGRPGTRITGSD